MRSRAHRTAMLAASILAGWAWRAHRDRRSADGTGLTRLDEALDQLALYRDHPRLQPWSAVLADAELRRSVSQALSVRRERRSHLDAAGERLLARLSLAEDRVAAQEALLRGDVGFDMERDRFDTRVHPGAMRRALNGLR